MVTAAWAARQVKANSADVAVAIELEVDSATPVDLPSTGLAGWLQVNGSCPGLTPMDTGDALALAVDGAKWAIAAHGGGCLGGSTANGYKADARAFAVALATPAAGWESAAVAGCPAGICLIALHSPHINITEGAATVAKVCGPARSQCTVAMGDVRADATSNRGPPQPQPLYPAPLATCAVWLFLR